jgi:heme exporter protein CcmD
VTHVGYLAAGYGITFAALAGYAAWVVSRRRALTRDLPPETDGSDHPWR